MILASALDASGLAAIITDLGREDNPIIYASEGFSKLTGYDNREILGRNCRFLQGSELGQTEAKKLESAIARGVACQGVLKNFRKDGTPFYSEVSISPFEGPVGPLLLSVQREVFSAFKVKIVSLTPREQEALKLLASSLGSREAALRLGISFNTFRNYTQQIYKKLDVHSRAELMAEFASAVDLARETASGRW